MKIRYKLWLEEQGEQVFGDGVYRILKLVDELGSINQAAQREKMSYRQAWGMIKTVETRLNMKLLERRIGGESGGGATLTPHGKKLIQEYENILAKVEQLLEPLTKKLNDEVLYLNSVLSKEESDEK